MARLKGKIKIRLPPGWQAQAVTERMIKPCQTCGQVPEGLRAVHTTDGYPFPTSATYCGACAIGAMRAEVAITVSRIDGFAAYINKKP